jgi:hypothetical protein
MAPAGLPESRPASALLKRMMNIAMLDISADHIAEMVNELRSRLAKFDEDEQ